MPSPCSCPVTVRETWRGSPRYSDGPSRSAGPAPTGGQASSTPGRCASSCVTAMRGLRFQMPDRPRRPEHVTLPLLTLVTAQSLDGDYRHVADRKRANGEPVAQPHTLRNAAIIVGIFGLMTAIAFVQTERNAAASEAGREQLITSISQERTALETRQARIGDLREETLSLSEDVRREIGRAHV